jgi:anti-repressor protein
MNLIQSNTKTMSSREIARVTGKRHSDVLRDIRKMLQDLDLSERNFASSYFDDNNQERPAIDLNHDLSITLVSGYNVKMRFNIIERWKELEQANQPAVPQTYAAALLEAGRLAQALEETSAKLIEAQPKAEFYDQVTSSKDAVDMASAAKVLNMGIGRNKLFELLRDEKVLQGNNQPYQKYIDNGCFRVIESKFTKPNGDTSINLKTVVYQKGLTYISKLINKQSNKLKGDK